MKQIKMILPEASASTAWSRGRKIEEKACVFLSAQPGMSLHTRNYHVSRRFRRGELDLIFTHHQMDANTGRKQVELVFVEVRSRIKGENWESAEESLSAEKLVHLQTAMEDFLWKQQRALPFGLTGIRLDLLAWDGTNWNWIRDVRI